MVKRYAYLAAGLFLMTGCDAMMLPTQDMQGHDPREYYARNPIENKIEMRHALYTARYAAGQDKLSSAALDELMQAFSDVSPDAAQSVKIHLSPAQFKNTVRRDNLAKFFRNLGYDRRAVRFESSSSVKSTEAEIDITYASVVPPRCPDWRMSPTTTHSNTRHGNIGCASAVNLGLMVADPRDLVRGEGVISPDGERNSIVIRRYREGRDPTSSDSSSSSGGASGGDSSAGGIASPPPQ